MLLTNPDYFSRFLDRNPKGFECLYAWATAAFYTDNPHDAWVYLFEAYAPWTKVTP